MARLQLLIPLILWAAWLGGLPATKAAEMAYTGLGVAIYFLLLATLILFARRWARRAMLLTTRATGGAVGRFHLQLLIVRWLLLVVHAGGLFVLGWGSVVQAICAPLGEVWTVAPTMLSTLPVALAWAGLSWAQYPLDRAVREQNVLWAFDRAEPLHAVPPMGAYVAHAVRTNILVTLVPIAVVMLLRDLAHVALIGAGADGEAMLGVVTTLVPVAVVVLFAPEMLRRIFPTEPLPPSPLRDRLEALCARLRLRYRDILLWHTHHAVGNAAVMGLFPQVRYVLLSDLILETMSERQIEAVFAHEAGHVRHHHLTWFAVFTVVCLIAIDVLDVAVRQVWHAVPAPAWLATEAVVMVGWLIGFFFALGALSRQFERQADLFAARSISAAPAGDAPEPAATPTALGAETFNSALIHVARINHMPLDADTPALRPGLRGALARMAHHLTAWRHGSIRSRIVHLQDLTTSPARLLRFNRCMLAVRVGLALALAAAVGWVAG